MVSMLKFVCFCVAAVLAVPAALGAKRPVWIYLDGSLTQWSDPCVDIKTMVDSGATHVLLSFYTYYAGFVDAAKQFQLMSSADQQSCYDYVHSKGGKIMLSAGGSTDNPSTTDPTQYATKAANAAMQIGADGLDFDAEGFPQNFGDQSKFNDWLVTATTVARGILDAGGRGHLLLTHAPQTPYFTTWAGANKGYVALMKSSAGSMIDFYLTQYYNQVACEYGNYNDIFISTEDGCWAPGGTYNEIKESLGSAADQINKIVLGKPANPIDASNTGYLDTPTLQSIVCQAESDLGYTGGLMAWSWRGASTMKSFFDTVAGEMCGGGSYVPAPSVPTTTTTKSPVSGGSSGSSTVSGSGSSTVSGSGSSTDPSLCGPSSNKRPVFMYIDVGFTDWSDPCKDFKTMVSLGVTDVVVAFNLYSGPADGVLTWSQVSESNRQKCLDDLHASDARLIMSCGGSTEIPTNYDAISYSTKMAQTALDLGFDGIDYDIEGLASGFGDDPAVYNWLLTASTNARAMFDAAGKNYMTISHAPQGPYLSKSFAGSNQGYVQLLKDAGDAIDYLLVQYYNQGACEYTTYDSIFTATESGCWAPGAAFNEIKEALGADAALANKIVLGKAATTGDVYNTGYISPDQIGTFVCQAEKEVGFTGGVMLWVYHSSSAAEVMKPIAGTMCGDYSGGSGGGSSGGASSTPPAVVPSPTTTTTKAASSGGGNKCFRNSSAFWWNADCDVPNICMLDETITDSASCLNTDLPYPKFVMSREDCLDSVHTDGGCINR